MTDGFLIASQLLLWLCVVAMGILLYTFFQVLRRYESERQAGAENSREGMGLQTGQAAPSFSAQAVGGERISHSTLGGAKRIAVHLSALPYVRSYGNGSRNTQLQDVGQHRIHLRRLQQRMPRTPEGTRWRLPLRDR